MNEFECEKRDDSFEWSGAAHCEGKKMECDLFV